ncbi:Hdhd2 [Symbiodinium natans]|uniref:Haloacid dehalogenase-like hydrolase domain-containing protein 2 n=1 Tax=Symbiodinium natans TaxID=878477 RepID=A0A812Q3X6_9DINO|nr:Hdhd2 [Symbiodinium natans]
MRSACLPRVGRCVRCFASTQRNRIRYALLDVDGVCILGGVEIPGSSQALARLRSSVRACRFITNQSQEPCSMVQAKLRSAGFHVGDGEIFSALRAARHFVRQRQLRPLCLLSTAALEEFHDVPQREPNAVVVGTAPEQMHYERLTEAMRVLLANEDSHLIAVNKGRYFQRSDGLALQAGGFVAALEYATGKTATVVGKPDWEFFHSAVEDASGATGPAVELPLGEFVMIGDDVIDDVQGAMNAGMKAILVKTGKYRTGDEFRCSTPPLAVVDSLADAVHFLHDVGLLE